MKPLQNSHANPFAILLGCLFIASCQPTLVNYAVYDIGLKEAVTPADVKQKYGEPKIIRVDSAGIIRYSFENEMAKILWRPNAFDVSFSLNNKTAHSIKILWDEAAFVDETGKSHRIMHSGVKYIDRNNPQPPTVVPREGMITDLVYPTDYVDYNGSWFSESLFPVSERSADTLRTKAQPYVGKTFRVLLPLQVQDVLNEYTFTFEIRGFKVETNR